MKVKEFLKTADVRPYIILENGKQIFNKNDSSNYNLFSVDEVKESFNERDILTVSVKEAHYNEYCFVLDLAAIDLAFAAV